MTGNKDSLKSKKDNNNYKKNGQINCKGKIKDGKWFSNIKIN